MKRSLHFSRAFEKRLVIKNIYGKIKVNKCPNTENLITPQCETPPLAFEMHFLPGLKTDPGHTLLIILWVPQWLGSLTLLTGMWIPFHLCLKRNCCVFSSQTRKIIWQILLPSSWWKKEALCQMCGPVRAFLCRSFVSALLLWSLPNLDLSFWETSSLLFYFWIVL